MELTRRSILVTKGRLWVVLYFDFDRLIYTTISLLCVSSYNDFKHMYVQLCIDIKF